MSLQNDCIDLDFKAKVRVDNDNWSLHIGLPIGSRYFGMISKPRIPAISDSRLASYPNLSKVKFVFAFTFTYGFLDCCEYYWIAYTTPMSFYRR